MSEELKKKILSLSKEQLVYVSTQIEEAKTQSKSEIISGVEEWIENNYVKPRKSRVIYIDEILSYLQSLK